MKQHSKLTSNSQQEQVSTQHASQLEAREFASAEELLRYDADHTSVPSAIATRLQASSATVPQPKPGWWKRLFGGKA